MTSYRPYSGIGSRKTPPDVCELMSYLGSLFAIEGYTLRSGGADKADTAFELGCYDANGLCEIYWPFHGFNTHTKNPIIGPTPEAVKMAEKHHPAWHRVGRDGRLMHGRNMHQVLGRNLDSPVEFVICWTPKGSGSGGTGQAIRVANAYGIPVYDLGIPRTLQALKDALGISPGSDWL